MLILSSLHFLCILHFTLKSLFPFFRVHICLDSSVSFCFFWFRKDAVISISFCEVICQSYVSLSRHFGCDGSLIHNFVCEALSFEGTLVFLSAVACFTSSAANVDVNLERTVFEFYVWHVGVAEFKRVSVEDLLQRMVSSSTLVHSVVKCSF